MALTVELFDNWPGLLNCLISELDCQTVKPPGIVAIEVCLLFNLAVVFNFNVFPFSKFPNFISQIFFLFAAHRLVTQYDSVPQ